MAIHFEVPVSQINVTSSETRRLGSQSRRLAGTWTIAFTVIAPPEKVAHIETKSQLFAEQPFALQQTMGTELLNAGASPSVVASLQVTGISVTKQAAGAPNTTTTEATSVFTGAAVHKGTSMCVCLLPVLHYWLSL